MAKEVLSHSDRYVRKTNRIILIVGIIALCLFVFGLMLLGAEEPEVEEKFDVETTIDDETNLGLNNATTTNAEIEFGEAETEEHPITLTPNPINMGQVVLGHEATNVLTIGTHGKFAIRIVSVDLEDAPFEGFSFESNCAGKELRGKITCNVLMRWLPTVAANVQNNFKVIWHETRLSERDAKHDEVPVFGNAVTKEDCNFCDTGINVGSTGGNLEGSGNLRYAVGPDGRIIGAIGEDGIVRDANGNEIGRVNADGLAVDRDGNVIGVASTGKLLMDANGNVIGYVDADGIAYDMDGNVIGRMLPDGTVVDAEGRVVGKAVDYGYVYDADGNIIGRVLPDGSVVDLDGNIIGKVNEKGEVVDFNGNIIGKVAKSGEVMFDENGNALGIVMPNGNIVNENGDIVGRVDKDGNAVSLKSIGKRGAGAQLALDKDGNVIGYIDENGVVRDFNGNIIGHVNENGNIIDENNNIVGKVSDDWADLALDENGNVIGYIDKDNLVHRGNEIVGYVNDKGEIIGNLDGEGLVIGQQGENMNLAYDENGNVIGYIDENGVVRDFNGNIIGHIDENGNVIDENGNIIGHRGAGAKLAYDANGNIIGYIDENGNVIGADGKIAGHVDENGNIIDEDGNIIGHQGEASAYAYDTNGNVIGYVDDKNIVRDFSNNILGIADKNGNIHGFGLQVVGRMINKNLLPITPDGRILGVVNNRGEVVNGQQVVGKMQPSGLVTDVSGARILAKGVNPGVIVNWGCNFSARLDKDGVVRRDNAETTDRVYADGTVWSTEGKFEGVTIKTGSVYDNECQYIGEASSDGYVRDSNGREVGCLNPDGTVLDLEEPRIKGHLVEQLAVYSANWDDIGTLEANGTLRNNNGVAIGCMNNNGEVMDRYNAIIGKVSKAKYAFDFDGKYLGRFDKSGRIHLSGVDKAQLYMDKYVADKNKNIIGYAAPEVNVLIDSAGKILGHLFPDGNVYDEGGSLVGKINGGENGIYNNIPAKFLYPSMVVDMDGSLLGKVNYDMNVVDFKGSVIGQINANGQMFNDAGWQIGGVVKQGGVRAYDGAYLGYVLQNGDVVELENVDAGENRYRRGDITGRVVPDGHVVKDRRIIGEVLPQTLMVDVFGNYMGYSNDLGVVVHKDGTVVAALLPGGATATNLSPMPQGFVVDFSGNVIGIVLPTGEFVDTRKVISGHVLADSKVLNGEGKIMGEVVSGDIVIGNDDKPKGIVGFDGKVYNHGSVVGRIVTDLLALDLQNNVLGHVHNIGHTVLSNNGDFLGRVAANGRVIENGNREIGYIKSNGSFVDADKNVSGYSLTEAAKNRRN